MGQRSRTATFMPGMYVFPGGAVDEGDPHVPLLQRLNATCAERLREGASDTLVSGLQAAAIREVSEETGLLLGQPGIWSDNAPAGWENFQKKACKPCARGFRFVFRAITPVGPPRRFDARFFLVNADLAVYGEDLDDFSDATDELSNLRWVPLDEIDSLRIAFITTLALETAAGHMAHDEAPDTVPCITGEREEALRSLRPDRSRFAY